MLRTEQKIHSARKRTGLHKLCTMQLRTGLHTQFYNAEYKLINRTGQQNRNADTLYIAEDRHAYTSAVRIKP